MTYYTSIIILTWIGLAILCVLVHENNRILREDKKLYFLSYLMIAAAAMFEWAAIHFSGDPGIPKWAILMIKCGDYILTPMAGGFLASLLNIRTREHKILFGLLYLNIAFQIVSVFTGWMTVVDETNHYSHGPLYAVYVLIYLSIITLVIIEFNIYSQKFDHKNQASLYGILIMAFVGIGIQEASSGAIRLSYISLAFGAALLFIHTTEFSQLDADRQIITDELTGLLNRYAYRKELKKLDEMEIPADLTIFLIDINDLKGVNDSLGHDAGDELIRGAAKCITSTFNLTAKCYRIGGDEFVVLTNMGKEQADDMMTLLYQKARVWKGEAVKEMSLACGYALASANKYDSVKQLIKEADKAMYAEKYQYYLNSGKDRRKFFYKG